jgi:hypothetical protein
VFSTDAIWGGNIFNLWLADFVGIEPTDVEDQPYLHFKPLRGRAAKSPRAYTPEPVSSGSSSNLAHSSCVVLGKSLHICVPPSLSTKLMVATVPTVLGYCMEELA